MPYSMIDDGAAVAETATAQWRAEETADVEMVPSVGALGNWDLPSTLRKRPREPMDSQESVRLPRTTPLTNDTFAFDLAVGRREDGETSRAGLDLLHGPAPEAGFSPDPKLMSRSFPPEVPFARVFMEDTQPLGCIRYVMVAPNLETSVVSSDANSYNSTPISYQGISYSTSSGDSSFKSSTSVLTSSPLSNEITTPSNMTSSPSISPSSSPVHRPRYRCRYGNCPKTYADTSGRSRHEKQLHKLGTSSWKCPAPQCTRKRFGRRCNCLKHIRKYHAEMAVEIDPIEGPRV